MIQRIIQTWKSNDLSRAHPIFQISQDSWKKHHSSWKYDFFDDVQINQYVAQHFPFFYSQVFSKYQAQIERVDIFRNITLYVEGGLYCDLDGECLKPFTDLPHTDGVVLGQLANESSHNKYSNAWMVSTRPKEQFWLFTLAEASKRFQSNRGFHSTEFLTGPILITDCISMYSDFTAEAIQQHISLFLPDTKKGSTRKSPITILEPHIIYPIDWSSMKTEERTSIVASRVQNNKALSTLSKDSHCIHYWTQTWTRPTYHWSTRLRLRFQYTFRKYILGKKL